MHQTKNGNQLHFGMKTHIGVDADSVLVDKFISTATSVNAAALFRPSLAQRQVQYD
jgi:IS5 family transposase